MNYVLIFSLSAVYRWKECLTVTTEKLGSLKGKHSVLRMYSIITLMQETGIQSHKVIILLVLTFILNVMHFVAQEWAA